MLNFSISVPNMDGFKLRLRGIPEGLKDLTDVWPGAEPAFTRIVINQWSTQGARGPHGAWADLDPEYARRKARKYGSQPILKSSGALFTSFLSPDAFHYEPQRMTFGTPIKYALYHQKGYPTRAGKGKKKAEGRKHTQSILNLDRKGGVNAFVPARRIFDLVDPQDRQSLQRGWAKALTEKYRRMGYYIAGLSESENPLRVIGPGEARLAGLHYYQSLS